MKLTHGVAISWDGRTIRHCTSVSKPDGVEGKRIGEGHQHFRNHLYGTFTAAKVRIVQAGRAYCNANYVPLSEGNTDQRPLPKKKRKHRKQKKKRNTNPESTIAATPVVSNGRPAAVRDYSHLLMGDAVCAPLPRTSLSPFRPTEVETPLPIRWKAAPHHVVEKPVVVTMDDLELGGSYKIPRKKKKFN